MYILISESRGVEYASSKKSNCIKEMKRLQADDKEYGYDLEKYYIDIDNTGFYKEGLQWIN